MCIRDSTCDIGSVASTIASLLEKAKGCLGSLSDLTCSARALRCFTAMVSFLCTKGGKAAAAFDSLLSRSKRAEKIFSKQFLR